MTQREVEIVVGMVLVFIVIMLLLSAWPAAPAWSFKATDCRRPPFSTGRNTGPSLISAAASHVCTASTGRRR